MHVSFRQQHGPPSSNAERDPRTASQRLTKPFGTASDEGAWAPKSTNMNTDSHSSRGVVRADGPRRSRAQRTGWTDPLIDGTA